MQTLTHPPGGRPHRSLRSALLPRPCYRLRRDPGGLQVGRPLDRGPGDLPERIELGREGARAAALHVRRPLRLTCTAGVVWLTCEGDPQDYVLKPGDHHVARPGDRIALLGMPQGAIVAACS